MLKDSGLFAQIAGQIKASFHSDYCAACAAGAVMMKIFFCSVGMKTYTISAQAPGQYLGDAAGSWARADKLERPGHSGPPAGAAN